MAATGTPAPQRPTRTVRGAARSRGAGPVAAPGLPPGPRLPAAVQTAGWVARPLGMLERARARYGDAFTLRILNEGPWVVLSHPDMVRDVFTGDPDVLRSGEANQILRPTLGEHSVLVLDGERHLRQRRLLLPPFHGERMQRYGALVRAIAEREVATWPRHRPFALAPADGGGHARGHHARGLRRARRRAPRAPARAPAGDARAVHRALADARRRRGGPRPHGPQRAHPRHPPPRRRAAARRDRAPARPRRTWPSARTCCRCSCRRATRTAARWATTSCATSS